MRIKLVFKTIIIFWLIAFFNGPAYGDFFVSPRVSTLGLGADLGYEINPNFKTRLNFNYFTYSHSTTFEDVRYDADLTLTTFGALLDYHPLGGGFRLSAGAYYNNNNVDLDGRVSPSITFEIGDNIYKGEEIGKLKGDFDFNDFAPYVGLGWGTDYGTDRNWHFAFDLGVMYQGSPNVSLRAENPQNIAELDRDISREISDIESDIDRYRWYPVLALGITYRF